MIDLRKKLPMSIVELLNNFNDTLIPIKKEMKMEAFTNQVGLNGNKFEQIKVRYEIKKSNHFFEIDFILVGDYINWKFYPYSKDSTKKKTQSRVALEQKHLNNLAKELGIWSENISVTEKTQNPLEFFNTDKIIKYYSEEIIEKIPSNDYESEYPLPSEKQTLAILLIEKQNIFLTSEINKINDKTSEKYEELQTAKENLTELKENISRMTISEIKQKWAFSFATILKWSKKQFISFMQIDKATGNDISRLIGSFVGGIFGIPKVDG